MKFRTEIKIGRSGLQLGIDRPVALVGSCFADNIGERMRRCLWNAQNPTGVLFNPLSIAKNLEMILLQGDSDSSFKESLFECNGIWHSWLFDSSISGSAEYIDGKYRQLMKDFPELIRQGGTLIVTFGTAWCYYLNLRTDYVVANCHKQPASMFTRRMASVEEIAEKWRLLLGRLKKNYPDLNVIFTVSPVRHVRDGLHGNQLSKATLLLAIDRLCQEYDFCSYFPAYEILNDDLRDYRFYADDLCHPSETAVEYIWEKFIECYIRAEQQRALIEGEKITKRLHHRAIISGSDEAKEFANETQRLYREFSERHPTAMILPIS